MKKQIILLKRTLLITGITVFFCTNLKAQNSFQNRYSPGSTSQAIAFSIVETRNKGFAIGGTCVGDVFLFCNR